MKNRGGHKNNQVMIGGANKFLNIPVIAVAVFQKFFRATRVEVTILLHSHIFKQKKYTILGATHKLNTKQAHWIVL